MNQLGNLVNRTLKLISLYARSRVPILGEPDAHDRQLLHSALSLSKAVAVAVDEYRLNHAVSEIWQLVHDANRYVSDIKPWKLAACPNGTAGSEHTNRLDNCLHVLATVLVTIALSLRPFLPSTAANILRAFRSVEPASTTSTLPAVGGNTIREIGLLFPKNR